LLEEAATKPGFIHDAYSRFWNYSLGNQLLAMNQCCGRGIEPGPLASFNRWKELGRHVKKGERALTLCMPIRLKCREWDEKRIQSGLIEDGVQELGSRTIFVFKRKWFVLAQTEGEPYIPNPIPNWNREQALAALEIEEQAFDSLNGNTQGYSLPGLRVVAVSPLAALPHKTLFHEIAHVLLGTSDSTETAPDDSLPRSAKEVEAESVALICCEALGLEGPDFSRGYIQGYLGEAKISDKSAQRIFQAADRILKAGIADGGKRDEVTSS
jgi:antirestriction protein ArdC